MAETQPEQSGTMDAHETATAHQSFIDQMNATAARLEAANKRSEEIAASLAEASVRERFEGRSTAGLPNQPAEESPKDYAKKILGIR